MAVRELSHLALSAVSGAVATLAGMYVARKVGRMFAGKPEMKMFHEQLYLSTRCTWLIAELGVESEFELADEDMPLYRSIQGSERPAELLGLQKPPGKKENTHNGITTKEDYQVVLKTPGGPGELDDFPDYDDPGPSSMIPTLVVNDEFTMVEGAATCMYLADLYNQFLPDPQHKAEYYSWIVYSAATFDNIMKTLQHQLVDTPYNRRNHDLLDNAMHGFHAFARALSQTLSKQTHLCGDRFTAADCVLGFSLWWAYTIQEEDLLEDYPVILAYLERLRQRPAFQKTFGVERSSWDWSRYLPSYLKPKSITGTK